MRGNSPFRAGIGVVLVVACAAAGPFTIAGSAFGETSLSSARPALALSNARRPSPSPRPSASPRSTPSPLAAPSEPASAQPSAEGSGGAGESLSPQESAIAAMLTAEIAVVDVGDQTVLIVAEVFDPAQGSFQPAGFATVTPDGFASQSVAAATYRLTFALVTTADLTATSPKPSLIANFGTCIIAVADGDQYQFGVSSDGVVVARNGESPAVGDSMLIGQSPLCQAPVPSAAPS